MLNDQECLNLTLFPFSSYSLSQPVLNRSSREDADGTYSGCQLVYNAGPSAKREKKERMGRKGDKERTQGRVRADRVSLCDRHRIHTPPWADTLQDVAVWGSPAAGTVLSPSSLVWLPGMTWRSVFSGDCGRFWARVAQSEQKYLPEPQGQQSSLTFYHSYPKPTLHRLLFIPPPYTLKGRVC